MGRKSEPIRVEFRTASKPIEETPKASALILKTLIEQLGLLQLANELELEKHHGVVIEDLILILLLYNAYGVDSIAKLEKEAKKDRALAEVIDDLGQINNKVLLYFQGRNEPQKFQELLEGFVARTPRDKRFGSRREGVLAVDDTGLVKTGKKMEKIEVIFDHAERRYVLGYVIVVVAYADAKKAYPVNFEFRLRSEEERQQAELEQQRQEAGIDLRSKGSLLCKIQLEEEAGAKPEWTEVTGVNLEGETLSKLEEKEIGWIGLPNGKTPPPCSMGRVTVGSLTRSKRRR